MICPKCKQTDGGDWSQCEGKCPMKQSPHYDWQTEMGTKVTEVKRSTDGQGRNAATLASRAKAKQKEDTIQRLKPQVVELINNVKENGYWEDTKRHRLEYIAWEMICEGGLEESHEDVLITLKRIKQDEIDW